MPKKSTKTKRKIKEDKTMYTEILNAEKCGMRRLFLVLGTHGNWTACEECETLAEAKASRIAMQKEGIENICITVTVR